MSNQEYHHLEMENSQYQSLFDRSMRYEVANKRLFAMSESQNICILAETLIIGMESILLILFYFSMTFKCTSKVLQYSQGYKSTTNCSNLNLAPDVTSNFAIFMKV